MTWRHDQRKRVYKGLWGNTNATKNRLKKKMTQAEKDIQGNRVDQYRLIKHGEVDAIGT